MNKYNYDIEGTSNVLDVRYANGELSYPTFQEDLIEFKNLIIQLEKDKKGTYPKGTINHLVDKKLKEYSDKFSNLGKKTKR